jgi:phenylalanyl-tRNA synthetase beta chain
VIVSLNWLKRYVDIEETAEVLADDLTMFGLNVEEYHASGAPFSGVVFGVVREVTKHPKADRLSLCSVDVGADDPLRIVCGASNVRAGLNVAVARHGAVLAEGFKIKRTKIRGEVSEGMICSEIELGIGDDADGIIELDFTEPPGTPLENRLGGGDVIFDIEITPNRPDLLSHVGIAREIAARYRRSLRDPRRRPLQPGAGCTLEIESFSDCPRYAAAFIDDVTIAPSPAWMQKLLAAVGLKPINNIVDVTNFVLMEMGQPLHAFDRDRLLHDTIVTRRARQGESLVTLDEVTRELTPDMLVIADAENPVALAGVMGGRDTEVTEATNRVLLESAMFDQRLVRSARMALKLETEASYRFEREADIGVMQEALERACYLIENIGAGKPSPFVVDRMADNARTVARTIPLRVDQTNRVMGTKLAAGELARLLERLGLESSIMDNVIQVSVPTFRRDLIEEIDIIEEAARVYGYENIGLEETPRCTVYSSISPVNERNENLCRYLAARGFAEVISTSFMDPDDPARFGWRAPDPRSAPLAVSNPLTAGQSALRTSLLPGLLGVVKRNAPAEQEGMRIFEMGKVFLKESNGGLPLEEHHITALFTRNARPVQWLGEKRQFDFFDMKGALEALIDHLGVDGDISQARKQEEPGYIYRWSLKSRVIAEGGPLALKTLSHYDIADPVYYFDLILDALPAKGGGRSAFTPISHYPAVKRDLCVVATDRTTFADIRNCILGQAKSLESIKIFDYYRGGHLGEGKRSYTFRLNFRSSRGTLDDRTVDKEIDTILSALHRELKVTLRYE